MKELLEELLKLRKKNTKVTTIKPTGSSSIHAASFDFASLYPSSMVMSTRLMKNLIRKKKIKKIMQTI